VPIYFQKCNPVCCRQKAKNILRSTSLAVKCLHCFQTRVAPREICSPARVHLRPRRLREFRFWRNSVPRLRAGLFRKGFPPEPTKEWIIACWWAEDRIHRLILASQVSTGDLVKFLITGKVSDARRRIVDPVSCAGGATTEAHVIIRRKEERPKAIPPAAGMMPCR
jgi:hypothetical protein